MSGNGARRVPTGAVIRTLPPAAPLVADTGHEESGGAPSDPLDLNTDAMKAMLRNHPHFVAMLPADRQVQPRARDPDEGAFFDLLVSCASRVDTGCKEPTAVFVQRPPDIDGRFFIALKPFRPHDVYAFAAQLEGEGLPMLSGGHHPVVSLEGYVTAILGKAHPSARPLFDEIHAEVQRQFQPSLLIPWFHPEPNLDPFEAPLVGILIELPEEQLERDFPGLVGSSAWLAWQTRNRKTKQSTEGAQ